MRRGLSLRRMCWGVYRNRLTGDNSLPSHWLASPSDTSVAEVCYYGENGCSGMSHRNTTGKLPEGAPMAGTSHRFVETNGMRMHVAEAGGGPLGLLFHGFPQCWDSWRDQ